MKRQKKKLDKKPFYGEQSKKDKAIIKSEKVRRIKAKNKANPMGKKSGGMINSRSIAKKYFKGGMV